MAHIIKMSNSEKATLILDAVIGMNDTDLTAFATIAKAMPKRRDAVFAGKVKSNGMFKHVGEVVPKKTAKVAKEEKPAKKSAKKEVSGSDSSPKKTVAVSLVSAKTPKSWKEMSKGQLTKLADGLQISISAYLKSKGLNTADNETKHAAVVSLLRKVFNFPIKNPTKTLEKLQKVASDNKVKVSMGRGRSDETTKVYRVLAQLIVAGIKPA